VAYYTVTADVAVSSEVLPGMQVTVVIPQEEAVDAVILNMNAVSFDQKNSAYVYMYNDAGELAEIPVELGVDNENYVEIVSGLEEGDVVYVEDTSAQSTSSGLAGLFSSFSRGTTGTGGRSGMSGFSEGTMPSGGGNGGGFSGGDMSGGNAGGASAGGR